MTRSAPILSVLFVLISTATCNQKASKPSSEHTADTLVIACREPGHLDPAYMVDRNDVAVASNLCTGLFRPAPDGGAPRLGLARSWSCVDHGRRCTFELDDEASWSDGLPVTAADLEWPWRRTVSPETGSPGAETLHVIQGMDACTRGEECQPQIRVLGPHKLEILLDEPQPMLPYMLAHPRWCPVPKQAIEAHGEAWTAPENYVGNGDFNLASWRRGISLTLERRAGQAGPGRVELRFTDSEDTALRWFEAGEVDIVDGLVPLDRVAEMRRSRPDAVRSSPGASVFYLAPNLRVAPFDDRNMRRAVTHGLDRETLVGVVLGTGQVPAHSIVPGIVSRISGYRSPEGCTGRNVDAARTAMAAAGHPAGAGLPAVEILYNQSATVTRIMTYVQQDLRDAMGLQTSLRSMEWAAFLDTVRGGDFSIARFGLSGEPDPVDFLGAMTTGAPNNIGGFASPEYDRLIEEARGTSDVSRRNGLLSRAEAILCDEAAIIPVYHSVAVILAREGVQGYEANHSGLHPLRDVTLDRRRP